MARYLGPKPPDARKAFILTNAAKVGSADEAAVRCRCSDHEVIAGGAEKWAVRFNLQPLQTDWYREQQAVVRISFQKPLEGTQTMTFWVSSISLLICLTVGAFDQQLRLVG